MTTHSLPHPASPPVPPPEPLLQISSGATDEEVAAIIGALGVLQVQESESEPAAGEVSSWAQSSRPARPVAVSGWRQSATWSWRH